MISPDLHLSPLSEMSFSHPVPGCRARRMRGHGSHTKGGHIPAAAKPECPKPPPKLCSHYSWKCSSHLEKALGNQLWPSSWPKGLDLRHPSQSQSFNILWRWPWKCQNTTESRTGRKKPHTDLHLNPFELLQDQPEALIWFDFTSFFLTLQPWLELN